MAPSIASRLRPASKRLRALGVWRPGPARGAALSSRHVWLAVAAGSVALLLIAAQRRRAASRAVADAVASPQRVSDEAREPALGEASAPQPREMRAPQMQTLARTEPARSPLPSAAPAAKRRAAPAPRARCVTRSAPCSIELPLPAVQRAALAITLGKPSDLRRLARDLQRAGQDIEAGLLENYALLLERTNVSRDRLLAEVTRMLRAAVAERRSSRRSTPAITWPPAVLQGVAREAPPAEAAIQRAGTAPGTPARAEASSPHPSDAVAVLPHVTVDARLRASR
jgi:hypothetical protein